MAGTAEPTDQWASNGSAALRRNDPGMGSHKLKSIRLDFQVERILTDKILQTPAHGICFAQMQLPADSHSMFERISTGTEGYIIKTPWCQELMRFTITGGILVLLHYLTEIKLISYTNG